MQSLVISSSIRLLVLLALLCSCATTLPQHAPKNWHPGDGLSSNGGLAYGRFQLGMSHAEIELRNEGTGEHFQHSVDQSGRFYWELPGGRYQLIKIWMGFRSIVFEGDHAIRFHVKPGKIIYLGTLAFRSPTSDQIGGLDIFNDYIIENHRLYSRYPNIETGEPPLQGLMYVLPPKETGGMFLDTIVNNQVMKPFLVDTGSALTVITKQTARELGINEWCSFPRIEILTSGGRIESPVGQVDSIQVGEHVVKDLEVVIDVDEHLPFSLLGMNFLQHFRVVVDNKRQQVRLMP